MDESAVIARAMAGDHQAFHELLERHSGPLLATLRARLANREDAREILQETWLKAWEHLARLREPGQLHAWLVSIALNQVRARARRARESAADPLVLERAVEDPGSEQLGELEELARLRAHMAELPARQREVVDLRVNHELSHLDIARLLGISEEASRANYYQALRRLKGALAPEGDDA
ncbi:MAG: sigma-70 family RNA polymerase sigma factor [Planctomycetota bacterium]